MSKKTIFMDSLLESEDEDEYISYSESERDERDECAEDTEEPQPIQEPQPKIKNKDRSISEDSESSESLKLPNFKCGSCKKNFTLDKNQNMIRCAHCGYRIIYKLRTKNYITYSTS